jgi:carbon storage regulator
MLVISRRVNESIQIGNDIEITISQVRGDVVRVGINAPQKTQVWRKELWDSIVCENRKAAESAERGPAEPVMPRLPVSAFSKLPRLRVVPTKSTKEDAKRTVKRTEKKAAKSPKERFVSEGFAIDAT